LREQRLRARLGAEEAGVVTPPRYRPDWTAGDGPRNAEAIAAYSRRLADRTAELLDRGAFPLILGGDCSIALGPMLALKRRGRCGLAYFDAHTDFRNLGNSDALEAAGGEDAAIIMGQGDARLMDLEGRGPSARAEDLVYVGVRDDAWAIDEVRTLGALTLTSGDAKRLGAAECAARALGRLEALDGFWIHIDLDVLDGALMPAVDSPEPDGLDYEALATLLRRLAGSPRAMGAQVTIYDPDLDPEEIHAPRIADCLVAAFA
jgi:arginase